MKKLAQILVVMISVFLGEVGWAAGFTLPFPYGEVWVCTQGNNDTPTHQGKLAYAWDFDWVDGDGTGKPIYPPADATVAKIYLDVANQNGSQGWGNLVVLAYDDGTFGKFAHVLNSGVHMIPVYEGQRVYQGETVISYVGGTSGVPDQPYASHIHCQRQEDDSVNGQSIPSTFVDVPGSGIPEYPNYYVAGGIAMDEQDGWLDDGRSRAVLNCFKRHGGIAGVGRPINDGAGVFVHYWEPSRYICQNFRNAQGQESIIIYDSLLGSQAYLVAGAIWEFYRYGYNGRYGPDILMPEGKLLGCPTTDEKNGIQYFEGGYFKAK